MKIILTVIIVFVVFFFGTVAGYLYNKQTKPALNEDTSKKTTEELVETSDPLIYIVSQYQSDVVFDPCGISLTLPGGYQIKSDPSPRFYRRTINNPEGKKLITLTCPLGPIGFEGDEWLATQKINYPGSKKQYTKVTNTAGGAVIYWGSEDEFSGHLSYAGEDKALAQEAENIIKSIKDF